MYHAQKPSFWQRQHANLACCREPNLIFAFLPRREFALSVQTRAKIPPQFRQIICLVKVGRDTRTRYITVAEDFCLFEAFLYTECAYSKTELESQGDDRSLERHCGQGNRPMSFRGVKRRGNPLNRNKNRLTIATTAFVLAITTAQRICAISSNMGKTPATISPNYLLGGSRAGHPHPIYYGCGRLQPIRSVLIHGMCLFEDGTRAARRREKRTPSLMYSTSERTSLDSFRPRTSDIKRER